jgi:hypothetical protein
MAAPQPIKLLAYADDLLVFANNRHELQAIQDRLTCYGRASNARVNYHKSVAFPLSGKKSLITPDLLHLTRRLRFQWYDSDSPSYIKYLGYPIWFTKVQRDAFCDETILKLQSSLDRHMTRSISVYGRTRMVNSLFLARLWHFLRITPLPSTFIKKVTSMVYQFICHKIFPPMKKSIIFSPRAQGGLSVLDITVQQHVLQQRYVQALLLDNRVHHSIPSFLLQTLATFIQVSYGASHPQLPLLFRNSRWSSPLSGLHCLLPLLRSVDAFFVQESWDKCNLSIETALQLPFTELCLQDTPDSDILHHNLIRKKSAHNFLVPSRLQDSLIFKVRSGCSNPGLLLKITRAISSNTLSFTSMCNIYLAPPSGPVFLSPHTTTVDFSPYLCHKLNYQGTMVLSMTNAQLRAMYMRDHPPITRPHVNLDRLTNMASFLHTKMPSTARNLWFRMIHNKISSKANISHILRLPDEICTYCGLRETTAHMLFTCPANREIWINYFSLVFFPSAEPLNLSKVYDDVMALNLSAYRLLDSHLRISVFEAVTCVITAIWRAKWRSFFDDVGFCNQSVVDRAMINLRHLSSLNFCK